MYSKIRRAAFIADRFEHRVPLARAHQVPVQWGGYNSTFLVMPQGFNHRLLDATGGDALNASAPLPGGPAFKRLTVVFVARLLRVVSWDTLRNGIANPQRLLFRVFREGDVGGLRWLVYGNASPSRRAYSLLGQLCITH